MHTYRSTHTHLTEPGARSDHLSGRQQAEEAHQGLTREDQRAHYHSSPLPLTPSPSLSLPFTSNKRPASLSLCLLGSDNRTCPEPKEMNYLPHSLLYSWKKIKSLFLYYHWTHSPCITLTPCSVALDVKCSEKFCSPRCLRRYPSLAWLRCGTDTSRRERMHTWGHVWMNSGETRLLAKGYERI